MKEKQKDILYFEGEHLRIYDIDADALANEPVVVEIVF